MPKNGYIVSFSHFRRFSDFLVSPKNEVNSSLFHGAAHAG